MSKKNIMFIHHSTGIGGAAISMITLVEDLIKLGHDVTIMLLKRSNIEELLVRKKLRYTVINNLFYNKVYLPYAHIEVGYLGVTKIHKLSYYILSWIMSRYIFSKKIAVPEECEIIHLNSIALSDLSNSLSKKAKIVMHVREPFASGLLGIRKNIIKKEIETSVNYVVNISKDTERRLSCNNKSTVVYNYVEPNTKNIMLASKSVHNRVVYLGGGFDYKGYGLLIKTIPYISPNIELTIAGNYSKLSSREKHNLNRLLKNYTNIKMIGESLNALEIISQSVLLLNLFQIPHFSRPIIEAYSLGKPVIATNVEGIDEIVSHDKTGIIVPLNDNLQLANRINSLVLDTKRLKEYGQNGLKLYETHFSADNARKISDIYDEL